MPFLLLIPTASFPQRGTVALFLLPRILCLHQDVLGHPLGSALSHPRRVAASPRVFLVLTWLTLTGGL